MSVQPCEHLVPHARAVLAAAGIELDVVLKCAGRKARAACELRGRAAAALRDAAWPGFAGPPSWPEIAWLLGMPNHTSALHSAARHRRRCPHGDGWPADPERLVPASVVAAALGKSTRTVERWMARGVGGVTLPSMRTGRERRTCRAWFELWSRTLTDAQRITVEALAAVPVQATTTAHDAAMRDLRRMGAA